MYVLQVYSVNEGGVWCRWNQCNGFVEILISFWHGCSPFNLRNLVSCPPALLKCCWLFVALITSQTFFFFPLGYGDTQRAKRPCCFLCMVFSWTKASSTGVTLNISVRDGKVIVACTLASDSPVTCDECLMGSASNLAQGCSSFLRGSDVSAMKCCWPCSHGVVCQECGAVGAALRTFSVERCSCGVALTGEHQLVQGGCEPCVAISSHLSLFWKLYYGPETENCPQINWILETNWWIDKLIMKAARSMLVTEIQCPLDVELPQAAFENSRLVAGCVLQA